MDKTPQQKPAYKVFITGCSRRLGFFIANAFLDRQYDVFCHYRTHRPEMDLLKEKGAEIIQADFTHLNEVKILADTLLKKTPYLNLIIHNASSFFKSNMQNPMQMAEDFKMHFCTHMQAPLYLNFALKPLLINAPCEFADIIHLTDIYADNPNPDFIDYAATKAGLQNLTISFAKSFAPKIKVNAIQPGPLEFLPLHTEEDRKKTLEGTLFKKMIGFEPILKTVDYIANTPFITGSTLRVDAGRYYS